MRKLVLFCLLLLSPLANAADPISTSWTNNLAVSGYDSVAYQTQSKAIQGNPSYEYEWQGATWRFSSADNLALFKADPDKYAPQFGGYCAWAVAQGKTASSDPTQFSVVDGKLYLNYSKSVQKKWLANRDEFIMQGHQNWPDVLN
jgi:YHS domain-containing protein